MGDNWESFVGQELPAMVALINEKIGSLESLCRNFAVARLELFGSAAREDFDAARSDLDFLVKFDRHPTLNAFRQFFGFQLALADLFGREVDLVDMTAMRNPYFIASVNKSRKLIYGA